MRYDILTLFPEVIESFCHSSIIGRAVNADIIQVYAHNIRDYSNDKHHNVDDTPFGGGKGMIMTPAPIYNCFQAVFAMSNIPKEQTRTIFMSPVGKVFSHKIAKKLKQNYERIIILCGHYEGVDERVVDMICDEIISIGDFVLTGGELPACAMVDAVSRLIDGVLADASCYEDESIASGLLEEPKYTRPEVFMNLSVPKVLLNGNHSEIDKWKHKTALERTRRHRPDLLE